MSAPIPVARLYVRDDLKLQFAKRNPIDWAMAVEGEVARQVAGRRTLRITLGERCFYLKLHLGVGMVEVLKNWLSLKQPVLGAANEYQACLHLEARVIAAPRVAAFAQSGGPAWSRLSFVLCDELAQYEDLETISLRFAQQPPSGLELRRLVIQVAEFARRLHDAGVVHRDFYICHLLRNRDNPDQPLAVLDLHRALLFEQLPERWRLRDLSALLFSVLDLPLETPLNKRAWLRFVRVYTGRPLKATFAEQPAFWRAVTRRALKLQTKARRKGLAPGAVGNGSS
jgi:heptose I phosphotransferase